MTRQEVHSQIWRNTLSNYVCVAVRLVMGLIMFRMMIQWLSAEQFGFWGLLWSLFGYSILLDFGFGFTAEKRVAELAAHQEWGELSRVLSTIFYTYLAVGLGIVLAGVLGSQWWIRIFQITPANREYFRGLLVIFFCGVGLAFPLGLFPEILRGLQRISLANYILLAGMACNFGLGAAALLLGWGLKPLLVITLAGTFIPDLICAFLVKRALPQMEVHPRHYSRGMIRQTMSFSLYAYVITVANIILTKTDHLVIGSMLAVSAVGRFYMPGSKVGEMFYALTQQLPDTLSPAAAHLNAKGSRQDLQELMMKATRANLLMATPLYCVCALMMPAILKILTGLKQIDPQVCWVAQILLLWLYMMVVTQSVPKRVFMMCGHERKLMALGVGEAALNLAASLILVSIFRAVWCVAMGSLIATAFFGWFYLWPWAAREARVSGWRLARAVLWPSWAPCLPLLGLALALRLAPGFALPASTPGLMAEGALALLVAALSVWILGLDAMERTKVLAEASKLFRSNAA